MKNIHEQYFPQNGILNSETLGNGEKRIPVRPLRTFSDLVVETMPQVLTAPVEGDFTALYYGFADSAAELMKAQLPNEGDPEFPVARLDVMIAATGLAHSKVPVPKELQKLVIHFSQQRIPVLTYEDIIHHNPVKTDPRTYSHGEVGADEEHFYLIHKDIEDGMQPLVSNALEVIAGDKNEERLVSVAEGLNTLVVNTRTVGRKMKHFDLFRPYLAPVPVDLTGMSSEKRYAGPSGAYSGTVHALDLALIGIENPEDEIVGYVNSNRDYFPAVDEPLLEQSLEIAFNKKSLLDEVRATGYDPQLVKGFGEIASQLLMFRHVHKGAVAKQIPQVLENPDEIGTGGISAVKEFLDKRIQKIQAALVEVGYQKGSSNYGYAHS